MIYIGEVLKNRMDMLSININELADRTFLDNSEIDKILNDSVTVDNIDEYDLTMISNVLHCTPEYFMDESIRKKDFLVGTQNRGIDTEESKKIKLSLQDYLKDFVFLESVRGI